MMAFFPLSRKTTYYIGKEKELVSREMWKKYDVCEVLDNE